jgi:hypothetical protein
MIKQRGNLVTKLLILGYIIIFLILITLAFSNVIMFNFQQHSRPVPPVVYIFQKTPYTNGCFTPYYTPKSVCGILEKFFFDLNATYIISGAINSTNGMSVFIIPTSADNAFYGSLSVHSPRYYTYYSGQTKYVQLNITLPAGSYYLYMLNLGTTDSNFTLAKSIVATLLSNS